MEMVNKLLEISRIWQTHRDSYCANSHLTIFSTGSNRLLTLFTVMLSLVL